MVKRILWLMLMSVSARASVLAICNWTGSSSFRWSTSANWSCNAVPNSSTTGYQIAIGSGGNQPSLDIAATLGPSSQMTLNTGATLQLQKNLTFYSGGSVANGGTIDVSQSLTIQGNNGASTLTLGGAGSLVLLGGASIVAADSGPVLANQTLANSSTIHGSGAIGGGTALLIVNSGQITANQNEALVFNAAALGSGASIVNTGTIGATGSGSTLQINNQVLENFSNSTAGTLSVTQGGSLTLSGSTVNDGRVTVDSSSILQLNASTLSHSASTLTLNNSGTINSFSPNVSSIQLGAGDTFTNSGAIQAHGGGALTLDGGNAATIWSNAGTIQANGGTLNVQNGSFSGGKWAVASAASALNLTNATLAIGAQSQLSIVAGATLSGSGSAAIDLTSGGTFNNQGTITSASGLTLDGGGGSWTNAGTISSASGPMTLQNGTFSGGTFAASAEALTLNAASIAHGNIAVSNGSAILSALSGDGSILLQSGNTFTNNGIIQAGGGKLTLDGGNASAAWVNAGTIQANGGTMVLQNGIFQGGVYSASNGELDFNGVTLQNASISVSAGSSIVSNLSATTISLSTTFGGFTNLGQITAGTGALTIGSQGYFQNTGTFSSSGAALTLSDGTFSGGSYVNNAGLTLHNATINLPASLQNTATLTASGPFSQILLGQGGAFSNTGSIVLSQSGVENQLLINGYYQAWNNAGSIIAQGNPSAPLMTVTVQDATFSGGNWVAESQGQLILWNATLKGSNLNIDVGSGSTLTGSTLSSGNAIFLGPQGQLTNSGTISNLTLDLGGQTWTNQGLIQANGGVMTLQNGMFQRGQYQTQGNSLFLNSAVISSPDSINNLDTIVGGFGLNFIVLAAGSSFNNAGYIYSSGGQLGLDGGGKAWTNSGTIDSNGGTMQVQDGTFSGGNYVAYNGTLVLTNANFQGGSFSVSGGTMTWDGATFQNNGSTGPTFNIAAGNTLSAMGETNAATISAAADFTNAGTVNAAGGTLTLTAASGVTAVNGGVMESTGGTLVLSGNWNNTGGTIGANAGTVTLQNGSVSGGNITVAAGAQLTLDSATLSALTIANSGTLSIVSGSQILDSSLSVTNNGSMIAAGGTFDLHGLTMAGNGSIGASAGGTLMASSGTSTVGAVNIADGSFVVSAGAGLAASSFSNGGVATVSGTLTVSGAASNSGELTIGGALKTSAAGISNSGDIVLAGASIVGAVQNQAGSTLTGTGTIGGAVTNNGIVHATGTTLTLQSASTNAQSGEFLVDRNSTLRATGGLTNSGLIQLSGTGSLLAGGTVQNSGQITGAGAIANVVSNSGTLIASGAQLTLTAAGSANTGAGTLEVNSGAEMLFSQGLAVNAGAIDLLGGRFDNGGATMTNSGTIEGFGVFASGGLQNNGRMSFGGGATQVIGGLTNSGTVAVTDSTIDFYGPVTNLSGATIMNNGGSVEFLGGFTNDGAYVSDPATNSFDDLTIGLTGYLEAGTGDVFDVSGDFANGSSEVALWNTADAEIDFSVGGAHRFEVDGSNASEFAWGELELGAGQTLDFTGAGAQYFDAFVLHGGLAQISSLEADGVEIFYNNADGRNAYLMDGTYQLAGGGVLAPLGSVEPTPEPSGWLLVGLGLLASVAWRRGVKGSASPSGPSAISSGRRTRSV